jgi:hypothetical protein
MRIIAATMIFERTFLMESRYEDRQSMDYEVEKITGREDNQRWFLERLETLSAVESQVWVSFGGYRFFLSIGSIAFGFLGGRWRVFVYIFTFVHILLNSVCKT